ncbi:MAG: hypothetical protein Q8R98_24480 [Rubrivivax sp.]|nr:hypothetical protein [Rubrivivax sp.]MDZ4053444.1 hypothetical protein [Phenylobacterium sp.]
MSFAPPSPPRAGRRRIHLDDAERARAYRERQREKFEDGEIARARWDAPTPGFVGFIAKRCIQQADDPSATASAVLAKVLQGIGEGGGPAALATAINFVTSRKETIPNDLD